jgi:hypothetical protein
MKNSQVTILSAVDTASATGLAIDVNQVVSASFQIVCGDATAAGTVKLQMSNDLPVGARNQFVPLNWVDVPSATTTVALGAAPPIVIAAMAFSYIRAVFTRTSGGSTTIVVNMNTLSA